MTQLIKSENNPGAVAITTIVTRSGIESLPGETTEGGRICGISKDDVRYTLLGDIQKIQDGEVHLVRPRCIARNKSIRVGWV
jgi:hypothetical protein